MTTSLMSNRAADNYRFAKSKAILTPAAGTYSLLKLPRLAFVTDVWLQVVTLGSSNTVSLGWSGNGETAVTNGFISDDIGEVMIVGLKRAQHDTMVSFEGKYFDSAGGLLTMTVGTTQTTGKFYAFAQFVVIH